MSFRKRTFHMHRRVIWLVAGSAVAVLLLAGIGIYARVMRPTVSLDSISLLQETADYVEVEHDGRIGRLYKHFQTGFEEPDFLEWFTEGQWTTMTLLSPGADYVDAYAELRREIFAGRGSFIDNRIDFESVNVHSGKGAARFVSVAPADNMVTAKSMLEHNQLWFVKGDELWFRGWFYLDTGVPFTIVDFQERGRHNSPGPRICIRRKKYIGMELKARSKPKLEQTTVPVPLQQWFELKAYLKLDDQAGHVRIWQDGHKIIDDQIQTLHSADSILNALEVGITATTEYTEMIVDDVVISHELVE